RAILRGRDGPTTASPTSMMAVTANAVEPKANAATRRHPETANATTSRDPTRIAAMSRLGNGDLLQDPLEEVLGGDAADLRLRLEDEPMGQDGHHEFTDVVRHHELAP